MIIEHFKEGKVKDIYHRFQTRGRMIPDGLIYVDSWVSADLSRCFQLMECDNLTLLQEWILEWEDLARFEIISVVASSETKQLVDKLINNIA